MEPTEAVAAAAQHTAAASAHGGELMTVMLGLIFQLAILIFAVRVFGNLAKRFKMPSVLGELLAGIIVGPYLLGSIPLPALGFEHGLFPLREGAEIPISNELYSFAIIASIILLFMAGLETDFRQFLKYSVAGTIIGLGGVVISFVAGDAAVLLFGNTPGMHALTPACLFLGALSTATSVGITARILSERKQMDSPEGVTILASAIIDDVLGIIGLAIIIGLIDVLHESSGDITALPWMEISKTAAETVFICIAFSGLGLALSSHIGRLLKRFQSHTAFTILALGFAFFAGGIFQRAGLSMIIGAYVMGLTLSRTDITFIIQERLGSLYEFFVPVFFAVMGMMVDVNRVLNWEVFKFGIIFGVLAVLAKIVGCALPALFLKFNMLGAVRIGAGMVPRGEVALIIAGIGMSSGVLDHDLFGAAIIMTLFTTVIAPPLLSLLLSIPGKGTTIERAADDFRQSNFPFPSEAVADAATQNILDAFRNEGFFISLVDSTQRLYHMRRDDVSFSTWRGDNQTLTFSSNRRDVTFIHTVVYEALIEMHSDLDRLKEMAKPKEFRRTLRSVTSVRALPGKQKREILQPDSVIMRMQAREKNEAIRELVRKLDGGSLPIKSEEEVLASISERENAAPTELEFGVSMPHGRTDAINSLTCAVGLCPEGMNFTSLDGTPVKVMILVASPKNTMGPHLQFLAEITASLRTQERVDAVLSAQTPAEVVRLLIGDTGKTGGSMLERFITGSDQK